MSDSTENLKPDSEKVPNEALPYPITDKGDGTFEVEVPADDFAGAIAEMQMNVVIKGKKVRQLEDGSIEEIEDLGVMAEGMTASGPDALQILKNLGGRIIMRFPGVRGEQHKEDG